MANEQIAAALLQAAASINPYDRNPYGNLAKLAYGGLQGYQAQKQAQQSKMLEDEQRQRLSQAIQRNPDDYAKAAAMLFQQGDFEGGNKLLAIAKQQRDMRDKLETIDIRNKKVFANPYTGQQVSEFAVGVSPGEQLTYDAAIRGQDMTAQTAANRLAFDKSKESVSSPAAQKDAEARATDIAKELGGVRTIINRGSATGFVGGLMSSIPLIPTDRKALEAKLDSIKNALSFSELMRLKQMGVSLGGTSESELAGLASQIANLNADMPREELENQLNRVEAQYARLFPNLDIAKLSAAKENASPKLGQGQGKFKVLGAE